MKRFRVFVEEIYNGSEEDYESLLTELYGNDFARMILQMDDQSSMLTGSPWSIETNGNVMVKFSEGQQLVAILGLLSKTGRLLRSDVLDMREWIERMKEAIESGKVVLTSVNQFSEPFINKIQNDMGLARVEVGDYSTPKGTWTNVVLAKEFPEEFLNLLRRMGVQV